MGFRQYYKKKDTQLCSVAFYNLENLFDTVDDPFTLDDAYTPDSKKNWTQKRYQKKLGKLGTAISNIGFHRTRKAPVIVGVAEVENKSVLEDLIATEHLKNKNFGVVHHESSDERGIDVGLLYQKSFFEPTHSEAIAVLLTDENGVRDYTRDILRVTGNLNGEEVHILVNHWPSRREGVHISEPKRIIAAQRNNELIDTILNNSFDAKIIVMGDFNDDPSSESVKNHLVKERLYNPMKKLLTDRNGSVSYRGQWNLFDQIIFTHNFHRYEKGKHSFASASIFDSDFLKVYRGRHRGSPFRTYRGNRYIGGYSDHFPVYINLKLNI